MGQSGDLRGCNEETGRARLSDNQHLIFPTDTLCFNITIHLCFVSDNFLYNSHLKSGFADWMDPRFANICFQLTFVDVIIRGIYTYTVHV